MNRFKTTFFLLSIILLTGIFSACKEEKTGENQPVVSKKLSQEDAMFAEMKAIDDLSEQLGQVATSLKYTNEKGESIVVHAFFGEDNTILKMDQEFSKGNNADYGKITYYLKEGLLFLSREYFQDNSGSTPKFVDRISLYEKGKVKKTIEKRVDYEDQLENTTYQPVSLVACNLSDAMDVLDQKGAYETTFQGFVDANQVTYLVVGEPKKDGFSSAIRTDELDSFIMELKRNPKKHLNRKIVVAFEVVTDPTGFEFQLYQGGKFAE